MEQNYWQGIRAGLEHTALDKRKSDLTFVFVHGLCGWGSYDVIDRAVPYFGFFGGSVIRYLSGEGYDCCGASVDPYGSAWDRACELYAQLAGKRVDYGKAHSERSRHSRFGRDFSRSPLMEDFEHSKIVLVGHSFGGATVRLFTELMRNGDAKEKACTDPEELSDFFAGGHTGQIFAVITLASPTNGTTAYDLYDDVTFNLESVVLPKEAHLANFIKASLMHTTGEKASWDYADYDMHIDNALALNERIHTFDDIYYFSYPCSSSIRDMSGKLRPDLNATTDFFLLTAFYMSCYTGTTKGGYEITEDWFSNDGMVNEISAKAPFGEAQEVYKKGMAVKPGIWYVAPTIHGDHMHLMGGVTPHTSVNIRPFFIDLLDGIIRLEQKA